MTSEPPDPLDAMRRRLASDPRDPCLLLNLAAHLRRAGCIAESSALYLRCYAVYVEARKPAKACACLRQLLRFDPDNGDAKRLLGS